MIHRVITIPGYVIYLIILIIGNRFIRCKKIPVVTIYTNNFCFDIFETSNNWFKSHLWIDIFHCLQKKIILMLVKTYKVSVSRNVITSCTGRCNVQLHVYMRCELYEPWLTYASIDLIHKSQNAPVPYPMTLHLEQKCVHHCYGWSIVGYGTGAFWDWKKWFVVGAIPHTWKRTELTCGHPHTHTGATYTMV